MDEVGDYFDPYGHAPQHVEFTTFMNEHCSEWSDNDRTLQSPLSQRFNKMETNLLNNRNYEIKVKHTNSKYCRFCIRHEIPKLIKDNYFPGKVLEKINSHSYSGFVHYAQNCIANMSKYVVFEIVTFAMIECVFEFD